MTKIEQINEVDEVVKYWPRLVTLMKEDGVNDFQTFLSVLLRCFEYGVVFAVRNDSGLCGICCAEVAGKTLILRAMPRDNNNRAARECIRQLKDWGSARGISVLKATSERLSGASFRYFEKTLGFRRRSVNFLMKV